MPPRFFYFDLGQVLVRFQLPKMLRQIAAVSEVDVATVEHVLFAGGLQKALELGHLTSDAFYEAFCRKTRSRPPYEPLAEAARAFFETNHSILPVVAQMRQARYRTGVLSNTCDLHWQYCLRQYAIIAEMFDVYALSYEIGAMKPDPAIFKAAADLAGYAPHEVFFTDDIAENVAGARAAGFDAVQYVGTSELVAELRRRGVALNY